jgi:hypothetical protein
VISITPARRLDWQNCSNLPLMGKAPGLIVDSNVTTCLPSYTGFVMSVTSIPENLSVKSSKRIK